MIKTSTNYDLIKELYGENSDDISKSLHITMLIDKATAEEYSDYKEIKSRLDNLQFIPDKLASIRLMSSLKTLM